MRMLEPTIRVRGLRMRYGDRDVLDGLDFDVDAGEVVALLGANGAGKTTTVEILEGFRNRSAGDVRVLGRDPQAAGDRWRADVGVVLQSWRDHGKWTPRELLGHLGRYYGAYSTAQRPRPRDVDGLIESVGLAELADARIDTLSGGERRRLDVAVGIVGRPAVLFLDEPSAGLDPQARRSFHDLVHELTDREETTILLTTHDLDEAEKLADRILILDRGRIVADGSAEALARRVSGRSEVRWSQDGEIFVHATSDPTAFVRELFAQHGGGIGDLEVKRSTLEDTYFALIRREEHGEEHSGELADVIALEEAQP